MARLQIKRQKNISIPDKFTPRFWDDEDHRLAVVREIRRRVEELKRDAGVESYQKDLLCQRAIFIALQLETSEIKATEGGRFDPGVHTQMVNCLIGLLKALGLEKKISKTVSLRSYVGRR